MFGIAKDSYIVCLNNYFKTGLSARHNNYKRHLASMDQTIQITLTFEHGGHGHIMLLMVVICAKSKPCSLYIARYLIKLLLYLYLDLAHIP